MKELPRAPGALVWGVPPTPTDLTWDEVKIVMEGILRVLGSA